MESHIVKILHIKELTHDVICLKVEKPQNYTFIPGQATEVSINKEGYVDLKRPFTFTGLNSWQYLELIIKIYVDHAGFTKKLNQLSN